MVIRIIHNMIAITQSVVSIPKGYKLKTFDFLKQLNGYNEAT